MNRAENAFFGSVTALLLFAVLWYAWNDDGFGKNRNSAKPTASDSTVDSIVFWIDTDSMSERVGRNMEHISIRVRSLGPPWMESESDAPIVSRGSMSKFQSLWIDACQNEACLAKRLYYVVPADSIEVIP